MTQRRFSDDEMQQVFAKAAELSARALPERSADEGYSEQSLIEIGQQAGLDAHVIRAAVRSLDIRTDQPVRLAGSAVGVGRAVQLDRTLSDSDWQRLVVQLREEFGAVGSMSERGGLRQWCPCRAGCHRPAGWNDGHGRGQLRRGGLPASRLGGHTQPPDAATGGEAGGCCGSGCLSQSWCKYPLSEPFTVQTTPLVRASLTHRTASAKLRRVRISRTHIAHRYRAAISRSTRLPGIHRGMMNTRSRTVSQSIDRSASDAVSPWRHLLAVDSAAGASVGVFMLAAHTLLSSWYGLPASLLIGTGLVNLAYAACSGTLSRLRVRPTRLVVAMALANVAWAPLCLFLAWYHRDTATPLGLAALLGEAVFVASLGLLEWHNRLLLTKGESSHNES